MEKFNKHKKLALDIQKKKKEDALAADRRKKEKIEAAAKKAAEEEELRKAQNEINSSEPKIRELTNEEAERLQEKLNKVIVKHSKYFR